MIKLINIDLDGTLLQKHYIISKENAEAIEYAKSRGVIVCVNTGRNSTSALYFSEKAGMNGPIICCGGSLILEAGKGIAKEPMEIWEEVLARDIILEERLPKSALELAGEIIKEQDISFYAQGYGSYYIVGKQMINEFVYDWDKKAVSIIDMGLRHFEAYEDFMEETGGNVVKMGFSSMDKGFIKELRERWSKGDEWQTVISLDCILEITKAGANKGSAIEHIRRLYGFEREEIGAIGDDRNDIAMFKACGKGVAMGNGCEELKAISHFIVDRCEENGVAQGIYKLLEG